MNNFNSYIELTLINGIILHGYATFVCIFQLNFVHKILFGMDAFVEHARLNIAYRKFIGLKGSPNENQLVFILEISSIYPGYRG